MRFFKSIRTCFIGLLCIHVWIYCTTHRAMPYGGVSIMTVMYLTLSASLLAIVLSWRNRPKDASAPRALDIAAGACMAASSCLLSLPLPTPPAANAILGAALGGLGVGWTYCRWGQFYAKLDIRIAAPLIFLSMAIGSTCKAVVDLMPAVPATAVLVCMPLVAYLTLYRSMQQVPASDKPALYFNRRTLDSLWRLMSGVAVFSLTVGVIQSMPHNVTSVPANIYPFVIHGGEIVFALAIFARVARGKHGINFSRAWSLILILMVTALIFAPYASGVLGGYLFECIGIAQTALIIVLYLALGDIARHSTYSPIAVFAAGWLAYSLPFALGDIYGFSMRSFEPYGQIIILAIVWVLVVATLFLLNDSAVGNHVIFTELGDDQGEDSPTRRIVSVHEAQAQNEQTAPDAVSHNCQALAEQCGLTPREGEILELLARGRSRAYIADVYFISENTVHGHMKRIYTKLDVHSKQELIDKVESAGLAS